MRLKKEVINIMKVLLNVTLGELDDKINRQILVDENISLTDLCEFVIVSMNGRKIPIYELEYNKIVYYPDIIEEDEMHKSLLGLTLKKLDLKNGKSFCIEYNFEKSYYFDLTVDNLIENSNDNANVYFKVLSGSGYGIIDDCGGTYGLYEIFNGESDYLEKRDINDFDLEKCNKEVEKV